MDMDAFRRDGFTVVKNVFTQEMRTRLDILRDQLFAQIEAGSLTRHAQFTVGAKSGDYEPFALHPPLVALAREVLGDQDISLYLARALVKDQHFHSDVEAHQDYPYFQGNITKLNAFVAVTPCDRSNGMLELYRGSRNYGPLPRGAISVEFYPQFEACVPSLDVGDCCWQISFCGMARFLLSNQMHAPSSSSSTSRLTTHRHETSFAAVNFPRWTSLLDPSPNQTELFVYRCQERVRRRRSRHRSYLRARSGGSGQHAYPGAAFAAGHCASQR